MTKYWAKKVTIGWITFDSKIEARYYSHLLDQKSAWDITNIKLQPTYELQPKYRTKDWILIRAIKYVADFEIQYSSWMSLVVDIKWMATEWALIKRKMFLYKYPQLNLERISFVQKYWWRIDYFELKRLRIKNK